VQTRSTALAAFLLAGLVLFGCDLTGKFSATKIKNILDHPRDYENKEVTVYGTVTESTSLLLVKFFEIQDETGAIKVVTDRVLPQKGEKILVAGRMESIELGSQRVIVLREKRENGKEKSGREPK
jgi:aspartyl/asparaginyl-tRNA synthetase